MQISVPFAGTDLEQTIPELRDFFFWTFEASPRRLSSQEGEQQRWLLLIRRKGDASLIKWQSVSYSKMQEV